MQQDLPDFLARARADHRQLGPEGAARLLEAGRAWDLTPVLADGGAVLFPHIGIRTGGPHTAAAIHACLDSGAPRVLVLGVLHALTNELQEARVRVAEGGDPSREASWGFQGPDLDGRRDWTREFSLVHFLFLWDREIRRRGVRGPELVVRYPYLAGGKPERLPGIEELEALVAEGAAVVATGDLFHHGIGYGDPPETARAPEAGGFDLARSRIEEGLAIWEAGDAWEYNRHAVAAKSDARDVGQVLRFLLGPRPARLLDLVGEDMASAYRAPAPTWVAGALVTFGGTG